jgi:hypothetical protein
VFPDSSPVDTNKLDIQKGRKLSEISLKFPLGYLQITSLEPYVDSQEEKTFFDRCTVIRNEILCVTTNSF